MYAQEVGLYEAPPLVGRVGHERTEVSRRL